MDPVIASIRKELQERGDSEVRKTAQRFFKGEISCYGLKTAAVTAIARKRWKEIKNRDKTEIHALCEELCRSGYMEEAFIAATWARLLEDRIEPGDIIVYRHWIDTYVSNWAECDGLCNHAVGSLLDRYPDCVEELKRWTQSENRWMRRAAAVSLIIPAKHGRFLDDVFVIADLLLLDTDDLVQKGYGWLLKEASRKHTDEVFAYVMHHRRVMPRTALRYAIELMPKDLRAEAMQKERQGG
ncbi:DNA alkylation repair protein [Methanofollis fontis]|uniref:DNA alkylation repair protein n=1 Tax=Methanofollis fontis TaxID=2052832 RepID=A0A483CTW4_9EURY|nr:DNA alkylation repair protein [Methanofollis fontis]TAJ44853.1 DNA alkylation repair protein [Methanofollis fontis]